MEKQEVIGIKGKKYMAQIKEQAKKLDITKFPERFIEDVAKGKSFDLGELEQDTQSFVVLTSFLIKQANENKTELTEEEVQETVNALLVDMSTESGVRKGWIKRTGKWSYRDYDKCKYSITPKGESRAKSVIGGLVGG